MANRHDRAVFAGMVDAIPPIRRPRGRPRQRPVTLHADKAYDVPRYRRLLHRRHIMVRIAREGIESSERLGRHRWVVARTLARLGQFRRLTIRDGRRDAMHQAFVSLGCALICLRAVARFC